MSRLLRSILLALVLLAAGMGTARAQSMTFVDVPSNPAVGRNHNVSLSYYSSTYAWLECYTQYDCWWVESGGDVYPDQTTLDVVATTGSLSSTTRQDGLTDNVTTNYCNYYSDSYDCEHSGTVSAMIGWPARASITLNATMQSANAGPLTDSYAFGPGIEVTPDGRRTVVDHGVWRNESFTISNPTSAAVGMSLSVSCTGAATNCSVSGLFDVPAQSSATVNVSVLPNVNAGPHGDGQIVLYATSFAGQDSGLAFISAAGVVSVNTANTGANWDRDNCVMANVGPGAAYQCGELRVVHGLPTVQTLSKARGLTMLYNSRLLTTTRILAANVKLPAGTPTPTTVTAQLLVGPVGGSLTTRNSGSWTGADFANGASRRIAIPFDVNSDPEGAYNYRYDVYVWQGSSLIASYSSELGQYVLAKRDASPYGGGWWPAGVEHLINLPDGNKAWIGGDGSTRHYIKVPGVNVWTADAVTTPDSLFFDGTYFIRFDEHRTQVEFDGSGQHVATVNRFGHTTRFFYSPGIPFRLDSVTAPQLTTALHRFTYTGAQVIVSTVGVGSRRTTTFNLTGSYVSSIVDPDSRTVSFQYTGDKLTSIVDARNVTTAFTYTLNHHLQSSTLDAGGPNQFATSFSPIAEASGLAELSWATYSSVSADNPYTSLNLPNRQQAWSVDRYGQPLVSTGAGMLLSTVEHGDARFPGRITKTTGPNGFTAVASFDARGRVTRVRAISPYGDGRDAETSYTWDDAWDLPTMVTDAEGGTSQTAYNWFDGAPDWHQDARGDRGRVTFYFSSGQLVSAQEPGQSCWYTSGNCERYFYDSLGNVNQHLTPLGYQTLIGNDAIGRSTSVQQQVDVSGTARMLTSTTGYDVMGRVQTEVQYASDGSTPVTTVIHTPDVAGVDSVITRRTSPDPNGIGDMVTRTIRDRLGRVVQQIAPDNQVDFTHYDGNGNIDYTTDRNGKSTHFVYDALSRMRSRTTDPVHVDPEYVGLARGAGLTGLSSDFSQPYPWGRPGGYDIPAVKDTFVYDPVSLTMTDANNSFAAVHRTYFANGQLSSETSTLQSWCSCSAAHIYTTASEYDRAGRRTRIGYPSVLNPGGSGAVTYQFDPAGYLLSVTDLQGHASTFHRNDRAELVERDLWNGVSEYFSYTEDGLLATDATYGGSPQLRNQTFTYDAAGHRTGTRDTPYGGGAMRDTAEYNVLGQLIYAANFAPQAMYNASSRYTLDGFGNVATRTGAEVTPTTSSSMILGASEYQHYLPGTGRHWYGSPRNISIANDTAATPGAAVMNRYDLAGNMILSARGVLATRNVNEIAENQNERRMYYAADGKLWAVDERNILVPPSGTAYWFTHDFEEHRYDALGRRVETKMDQYCDDAFDGSLGRGDCRISGIRRVIWDGTQELGEIQVPNEALENDYSVGQVNLSSGLNLSQYYGAVAYVFDGQVDQPTAVTRLRFMTLTSNTFGVVYSPFTFYPLWNSRGLVDALVSPSSPAGICSLNTDSDAKGTCINYPIQLPSWYPYQRLSNRSRSWFGSLLEDKQGAGGLMYRRNRYYDSRTGRFTQEDPAGLGGGINLYGFAGGDPVNFSDPFGLCKGVKEAPTAPCEMIAVVLAESDGGLAGYRATASVIMNRAGGRNGVFAEVTNHGTWDSWCNKVCSTAMNYPESGDRTAVVWDSKDQRREREEMFSASMYSRAAQASEELYTGKVHDTTHGANHMFRGKPSWAKKMRETHADGYKGVHRFFDDKHQANP